MLFLRKETGRSYALVGSLLQYWVAATGKVDSTDFWEYKAASW